MHRGASNINAESIMKVTVCFGNVRVVVPCGTSEFLVRDLIREASLRYKKAAGKGPDSWLAVHNLQSQGGGILDPDDHLSDVVDDREQILASFEDGEGAHHHGGGDGASGSSVGTGSPDIFHDGDHKYGPGYTRTDIEVTGEHLANGVAGVLQVRRGSEPALNQLPAGPPLSTDQTKRWSAAPLIFEQPANGTYLNVSTDWVTESRDEDDDEENDNKPNGIKRISRDGSNRLSMQFLGEGGGYKWAEAAERAHNRNYTSTSLPRDQKRKEPLGQANNTDKNFGELIVIRNEPGPLGIHVVPDYNRQGDDQGLLVQGIEPDGRIDRDGRLALFDRIVEINGHNLLNMPFQRVQEMFKLSLTSPELRLRVTKANSHSKLPAPVYPRMIENKENIERLVEVEQKQQSTNTKVATVSPTKKVPSGGRNTKSLLIANTRKIGRKIELELTKGPHGLGFSITTRDNPAGGNCPIYIKNIIPKGAAVEDGRLKIGDRLLEVNGIEMTGKSQSEAAAVLRNTPTGSTVGIVVSRQEDVTDTSLPRIIGVDPIAEKSESREELRDESIPPTIPPLPQMHHRFTHQMQPSPSQQMVQMNTSDNHCVDRERERQQSNVSKIISQFQEATNTANITPNDKLDDSLSLPWRYREYLTFNIPVHDSEKAGLGISVKGKTSGAQDLGIFIKSVIHGGAASRDKRLRTNDQLLSVNGISLLNQSNSDAMENLRKTMCHNEGPVPGNITLTIARRAFSPALNRSLGNPHETSFGSNKSREIYSMKSTDSDNSGGSVNTIIYNPLNKSLDSSKGSLNKSIQSHQSGSSPVTHAHSPMNTWNPVLDRLMGNTNKQLRNESYYKATNDTWNASTFSPNQSRMGTTINLPNMEPVLVEDDYGSRIIHSKSNILKPASPSNTKIIPIIPNNGVSAAINKSIENRKDHEPDGKSMINRSICDKSSDLDTSNQKPGGTDATYASQLSLENPAGFCRDAFGRQSMSEKRHATLDAKSTDTYQRTKKMREERLKGKEDADKLGELGPSLGMKKSSSLESLQTMVQEIQMQEEGDPAYSYRGPGGALKVIRGKGCEESFRAAVDKEYSLDPNHRSEVSAKKHWLLDPPADYEREIDGFNNVRGGLRQSSLNAALDSKHKASKKKPSILKGIGSMFRFGKHRKIDFPVEEHQHYQQSNEFDEAPKDESNKIEEPSKEPSNQVQQPIPHQQQVHSRYPPMQMNPSPQQAAQIQREPIYQRHGYVHHHAEQVQVIPENAPMQSVNHRYRRSPEQQSRAHGSNLLKAHEQRMAARHSYYPPSEADPHYEQISRQRPPEHPVNNYGTSYGRPGSRTGVTEAMRPPLTHYVNHDELQSHLSRKQHQYHSQRQPKQEMQLRPVSNFYEYESVQSILSTRGRNSNPHQYQQHPPPSQRVPPQYNRRGPFVTQVTIGEQKEAKQNGTKV